MSSCPFCQKPLTANDLTAARCPACGRALTPVPAQPVPAEGEATVVPGQEIEQLAQTLEPGQASIESATPGDERLAETLEPGAIPQEGGIPDQRGRGTADERRILDTLNVAGPPPEAAVPEELAFGTQPASGPEKPEIERTLDSAGMQVPAPVPEEKSEIAKTLDSASLKAGSHPTPEDAVARTLESGPVGAAPSPATDEGTARTLDSGSAGALPLPPSDDGVARTLDSGSAGALGEHPTPGGAVERTIDSGSVPGTLPPIVAAEVGRTLESDSAKAGAGGPADERLAETYGSGKLPSDVARDMLQLWSGKFHSDATPRTSIKAEAKSIEAAAQLVIQPRVIREAKAAALQPADYELVTKLPEGGMGVVYTARQASMDRIVALKMIKPHLVEKADVREKFLAEAVITGELEHPNIVPIYDVCRDEQGRPFYSMKLVRGKRWDKVLGEKSQAEQIEVLMKIADAVAFAHSRGIIHRDLKPENTMIGDFGEVVVMDWGLALSADPNRMKGELGGTPAYMAPEMAKGPVAKITPASDVYLLGAMLFEIVTGKTPHTGKNVMECLFAAARNQLQETEKSGELLDIARKAMATRQEDRYANVAEFQKAIREYQSHAQSVLLSTRADADLARAREADDYETYSRAIFGFHEALSLWSGNERAAAGAGEGTLAYAQSALRKGDFDLGLSLLDPADPQHAPLVRQLQKAQRDRNAREQRNRALKRLGMALAACLFVVVTVAFFWIRSEKAKADEARVIALAERDKAVIAQANEQQQREAAQASEQKAIAARAEEEKQRKAAQASEQKAIAARAQEAEAREAAQASERKARKAADDALAAQKKADEQRIAADAARKKETEARKLEETARKEQEYQAYIAKIGLAATKIDENAFDSAVAILDTCPLALRGWEWGRLKHLCSQHIQSVDAQQPVNAVAYTPDGKRFVTGGWGGVARIWDAASGKQILEIPTGSQYIFAAAFSPDGTQLALGTNDRGQYLRIWDATSGKPVRNLGTADKGHVDAVLSVAWSKDGKQVLSSSYDHTAILWDTAAGQVRQRFRKHDWWVWSAAFSPDEQRVVTASQDGSCLVWSASDGKVLGHRFLGHSGPVYTAVFSPDGRHVASGGYDKQILLWEPSQVRPFDYERIQSRFTQVAYVSPLASQAVVEAVPLLGHMSGVRRLQFSADGRLLVSAGNDNTVRVWDAAGKRLVKTLRGHGGRVSAAVFAPTGGQILSGSHDHHAKIWDLAGYEEVRVFQGSVLEGHADAVLGAAFSADGNQIITASRDRTARIWDAASGKAIQKLQEGHEFLASRVVFLPGGQRLVTAAVDNTTRVWDVAAGMQAMALPGTGSAAAMDVSHDGKWILTGSSESSARLWDAVSGKEVRTFRAARDPAEVSAVAFSADDRWIAIGEESGACRLWETATGRMLWEGRQHTRGVTAVAFVPGTPRLLTASTDDTVFSWDVSTGQPDMKGLLKHPDAVTSLAISPDGKWAATTCGDGGLRLWEIATARELLRVAGGQGILFNGVRFAPDGRRLAAVGSDNQVRLWAIGGSPLAAVEQKNSRGQAALRFRSRGLAWALAFAPDGSRIAVAGGNEAWLWQMGAEGEGVEATELMRFSPSGAVASAGFSPDARRAVTGGWDSAARIWDTKSGRGLLKLKMPKPQLVNAAAFSPKGERIVTAGDDPTAIIWDATSGKPLTTLVGHQGRISDARFSTDGQWVLTASADKTARIWNAATGKLVQTLKGHGQAVVAAAFSPDGKRVITGSEDNTARVWDTATGKELGRLEGHSSSVSAVAFSPDGRRAITGSQDNTAKIWEVAQPRKDGGIEGKELLTLRGHSQDLTAVALSPDGYNALTGSRDGTVYIWRAASWTK